jgi:urease gamma subunit
MMITPVMMIMLLVVTLMTMVIVEGIRDGRSIDPSIHGYASVSIVGEEEVISAGTFVCPVMKIETQLLTRCLTLTFPCR